MTDAVAENTEQMLICKIPAGILNKTALGFVPTVLQGQTLYCFTHQYDVAIKEMLRIKEDEILSPAQCVNRLGHFRYNWYSWQGTKGFQEWWAEGVERMVSVDILPRVHQHHARLAQKTTDASMLKLFYQRFDGKYVERLHKDVSHEFAGFKPPENPQETVNQSRKRIASYTKDAEPTDHAAADAQHDPQGGVQAGACEDILPPSPESDPDLEPDSSRPQQEDNG